jgi:drug/metabolite transporter (DMT)-like permease
MAEARAQHRLGIALVVAAAIAWSTAPFFTRLLPYDSWTILFWRGLFGGGMIAVLMVLLQGRAGLCDLAGMDKSGWRLLPSGQAALISTLETPLMPFWIWVGFGEVPTLRVLVGGALVMGAVIADIIGDSRTQQRPPG